MTTTTIQEIDLRAKIVNIFDEAGDAVAIRLRSTAIALSATDLEMTIDTDPQTVPAAIQDGDDVTFNLDGSQTATMGSDATHNRPVSWRYRITRSNGTQTVAKGEFTLEAR